MESAKNRPIVAGSDADTDAALGFDIAIPLVIDLDSTLLATDTLHESLLLFLKRRPTSAWQIPIWGPFRARGAQKSLGRCRDR